MPSPLSGSRKELLGKLLAGNPASIQRQRIPRRPDGIDVPTSYAQQQIWLHSQFSTEVPIYNEPVTVHRYGPMDRTALERAFTEIVRRHEAWRTVFGWKGSELVQLVQSPPEHIEIPYLDVSTEPAGAREEAALQEATADALAPFDPAVGPLYRPRLVRFSEAEHRLYLALHHIIFDGFSLYRIFLPELQALYEAFSQNLPSPLPPLSLQYGDYAVWQRKWVDEVAPRQLAYWRTKLAGAAQRDTLKTDHPRPSIQSYRGEMVKLSFDSSLGTALEEMNRELKVTPFMFLLAAFYILMWSNSHEEDLTIGISSVGRPRAELEEIMGYFLDTVVLRSSLAGDPSFIDLVIQCKDDLLGALDNDGVPFSLMVRDLSGERNGSRHPFFQVLFSLLPPLSPLGPGWKFSRMDIHTGSTKFDLNLELDESPQGIEGRLIYNRDLFERSSIEEMVEDWLSIVAEVAADPSRRISEIAATLERHKEVPQPSLAAVRVADPPRQSTGFRKSVRRLFTK